MRVPGRGRGCARHRRGKGEKRHQAKAADAVPEIGHALPPVVAVSVRQATKPSLYERRQPLLGTRRPADVTVAGTVTAFLSRAGKTASRRFPSTHPAPSTRRGGGVVLSTVLPKAQPYKFLSGRAPEPR